MPKLSQILSKKVTVTNELGVHARSAAMIAIIARKAKACVWIEKDGERVDATSIIDILTLDCPKGINITITINTPEDKDILDNIVKMFKEGFGE
jgi:phosphotransferase system HPr (HPr) family protein